MNLVDQEDVAPLVLPELVLGVDQQQTPLGRLLLAKLEQCQGCCADLQTRRQAERGRFGTLGVLRSPMFCLSTLSQSCWLISPRATMSWGLMGSSWSSALVVGVMTLRASLSFFFMPSGNLSRGTRQVGGRAEPGPPRDQGWAARPPASLTRCRSTPERLVSSASTGRCWWSRS